MSQFDYPQPTVNPLPEGDDSAAWRDWADGTPIATLFGVRCLSFERGHVVLELPASPTYPNPNGSIHGGVIAAIVDDAVGSAFVSFADRGTLPATASLTVDYLRPAFAPLRIEAKVFNSGRSLMHCDVAIYGRDGKLSNRGRAIMAVKSASVPPHAQRKRSVPNPSD